jgi:NitT/TauT family transport system permease protein
MINRSWLSHPWLLGLAGLLLVLASWNGLTAIGWVDPLFLPSPAAVIAAGQAQIEQGLLWRDLAASGGRLLEPLIGLIRYMPAPAFIPLLIIYFGLGELPKILLIFIGTLFFNTLMVMDSVKFVPPELIEAALTLGGRRSQLLVKVIAPCIAPQVLDAFRINMAAAWNLVIVAELVAATEGLGKRISLAQRFLRTDEIFLGLFVIGCVGLLIDLGFRQLMRRTCSWAN